MIGSALSLEVLSYYVDFVVFWPLFLLCFTVVLVCFSINTYYNGMYSMFRDDNETDNKEFMCGLFFSIQGSIARSNIARSSVYLLTEPILRNLEGFLATLKSKYWH